ncbi:hypothetical protein ACYSNO_09380 [Enterococcus sp. LJL98]
MLLENMDNQKGQMAEVEKRVNGHRRYSLLMLALLFIGMATYGTYAYFTDSTNVAGQIELKTGTVSLGQATKADWVYGYADDKVLENTVRDENVSVNQFTNLQPGDFYTKTVKVAYTGSLNAKVTAKIKGETELKQDGFTYTVALAGLTDGKVLAADDGEKELTVTLTASVDYSEEPEKPGSRNREDAPSLNLLDVEGLVTITAEQIRN